MTSLATINDLLMCVSMHRQFQVLTEAYNNIMQKTITPFYLILSPTLFCVAVYTLMALGTNIDGMSLVTLIVIFGLALSQNFICFYFAIEVYKTSRSIHNKDGIIQRNPKTRSENDYSRKLFDRYWRSFPIAKIRFLDGNFFEDCTCLIMLQFSVDQAVSLILME